MTLFLFKLITLYECLNFFMFSSVALAANTIRRVAHAARDPEVTKRMIVDMIRMRKFDTKANYFSCLKDYFGYCFEKGLDPFKPPIDPHVVIYWMYSRVMRLGSANSHKTWSASISWWAQSIAADKNWYNDHFYQQMKKQMLKLYLTPRGIRLPMEILWVIEFFKGRNVNPLTWWTCNLEDLTELCMFCLAFFTMGRPAETLETDQTELPEIEIIQSGVKWKHVSFYKQGLRSGLKLVIPWQINDFGQFLKLFTC